MKYAAFSAKAFLAALTIFILLLSSHAKAADYYWVNGSGNWSDYGSHWATTSGGVIFHTTIPDLNDDVFFDANSFSGAGQIVVLDSTFIYCRSMDWTGASFNPQLFRQSTIKVNIYGSLILCDSMTINLSAFHLLSDSLNNELYSGNIIIDSLYFDGLGSWDLQSNLNCNFFDFHQAIFNTNGFDLQFIEMDCHPPGGIPTIIDMGTSEVTFSYIQAITNPTLFRGKEASFIHVPVNGYRSGVVLMNDTIGRINSNTSLNISGKAFFNEIVVAGTLSSNLGIGTHFIKSGIITVGGSMAYIDSVETDTLIFLNEGVSMEFYSITVHDFLQIQGTCEKPVSLMPTSFLNSAVFNSPTTNLSVDYVVLHNIQATGSGTLTANNSYAFGNSSGWVINSPAPRNLFWIGNTGNWSDPVNWSLTSGGIGGNCPPSPLDNVNFDANSFSGVNDSVKMDVGPVFCHDMNWTGATGSPILIKTNSTLGDLEINGSLTCIPAMTIWSPFDMISSDAGNTITTNGLVLPGINFTGSGTWELTDNLNVMLYASIMNGAFQTNGHSVQCAHFAFGSNWNTPVIDLDTSTVYISESFEASYNGDYILIANNANIVVNDSVGMLPFPNINGFHMEFNNITFLSYGATSGTISCNRFIALEGLTAFDSLIAGYLSVTGSATLDTCVIDTLIFNNPGNSLRFLNMTINDHCEINGICGYPVQLESPIGPFIAKLQKNSGTLNVDFCNITNVTATGGALFTATNSYDIGGNTGWTINSPASRNLYWVGGTGNWSDVNHWSLSSGGTGGNCLPGAVDNLFFDANSFLNPGDSVIIDVPILSCHDMDWGGAQNTPTFVKSSTSGWIILKITGSLVLSPGMTFIINGQIDFNSEGINTITSNGVTIDSKLNFQGGGTWSLNDNISSVIINFYESTFNTNNFDVDCSIFISYSFDSTYFNLGTSKFYLNEFWVSTFTTGTPELFFKPGTSNKLSCSGLNIANVVFEANAEMFGSMTINNLLAKQNLIIHNPIIISSFVANKDVSLYFGATLTANDIIFRGNVSVASSNCIINGGSIHFDNPGKTVLFQNISVTNYLTTTANAGFPVHLKGYTIVGTITKNSGLVCLDNLLLQDVTATGGAQFFAGANSVDLGGNSGWTYTTCATQPPDVWPGDANYDLTANNFDVLNVGLAYGLTGPVRVGASIAWIAQPASDWAFQFANAANLKHTDTDGNGTIDADDTTAISINYGLIHPMRLADPGTTSLPGPPLYVVATPDTVAEGDTVQIDIFLGTTQIPVDSIYGLAFTLSFDSALIDTTYMPFDYTVGWMGVPNVDLLTFEKKFLSQGMVDVAITRTDYMNMGGSGIIVSTGVVIIDNIGARLSSAPPYVPLPITISNVRAVTASEYYFSLSLAGDQVEIDTLGTTGLSDALLNQGSIRVFPNPADEKVHVISERETIVKMELFDKMGVALHTSYPGSRTSFINTSELSAGIYILECITKTGKSVNKIVVSHP